MEKNNSSIVLKKIKPLTATVQLKEKELSHLF